MITNSTKIVDIIPDGYEFDRIFDNNGSSNQNFFTKTIRFKKIEPSKELATELGFKIGDGIWSIKTKKYFGVIESFNFKNNDYLYGKTKKGDYILFDRRRKTKMSTNKVVVHCPNLNDFKFIHEFTNQPTDLNFIIENNLYNYNCLNLVHGYQTRQYYIENDYLILTVDEYMESIEKTPLIITHDKVKIWNSIQVLWYVYDFDNIIHTVITCDANTNCQLPYKLFSSEQAAKDYIDSIKKPFEIGKWYKLNKAETYVLYSGNISSGFHNNVWNEEIFSKNAVQWREANMDVVQELLFNECKKRFPIGSNVKSLSSNKDIENIKDHESIHHAFLVKDEVWFHSNNNNILLVYKDGKFAEIIAEDNYKFEIGDIVKSKVGTAKYTIHGQHDGTKKTPFYWVKNKNGKLINFKEPELELVEQGENKPDDIIDVLINKIVIGLPKDSIIYLANECELKTIKVSDYTKHHNKLNSAFFLDKKMAIEYHLDGYKKYLEKEK